MSVVREILGRPVEFGGDEHRGWLPAGAATPPPTPTRTAVLDLRVLREDDGFTLEWKSRNTDDHGDTWHATLEDAISSAVNGFGIDRSEWGAEDAAS